jgi:hypothetical protein
MLSTPNMGLIAWNLPTDAYNSEELAENFVKLDLHDHTNGKGQRITTAALADNTVTAAKLHPDAVADATIGTGSISNSALADNAVTTDKVADGTLLGADLAAGAIDTAQIAANAVTRAKIPKAFIQAKRVAFVSQQFITITWDTSFGDTNYTVIPASTVSTSMAISTQTATQVQINLSTALTGTLHVLGIHD